MVALQSAIRLAGYDIEPEEIYHHLREISLVVVKNNPGPPGPPGQSGQMGPMGRDGKDAWDKYAYNTVIEQKAQFFWKGVEFWCPVPRHLYDALPVGKELTYGDLSFISTVYGNEIVERMAVFWRREFDLKADLTLFINEEDKCNLASTNKLNSSPDHLKV